MNRTRAAWILGATGVVAAAMMASIAIVHSQEEARPIERHGMVIKLRPEKYEQYKTLHADVWPEVLDMIRKCNIRNYSIYHKDGYLFSYFDYTGDDFAADMAKMAADPTTQKWWELCEPCQEPLETRAEGEWWAEMEELFHTD